MKSKKIAFLFPGQGAQYPGMGRDLLDNFSIARSVFEEADELLQRKISSIILNGPENTLTETKNSQVAIFIVGIALLRVVQNLYPHLIPFCCAGLSLGEFTALTAANFLSFDQALALVQYRGTVMNEACEQAKGTMAVVLGLDPELIEKTVKELQLPNDLWIANYNCPGQIVISGTAKGVQLGAEAILKAGAKRVLPLQVHGAFHSGLMKWAKDKLTDPINKLILKESPSELVMNVPGDFVQDPDAIRNNLIKQVTSSVRWEQGVRAMTDKGIELFIEFGPGKTLSAMNKRMNLTSPTISLEKVSDLNQLENL
jgi:[acyl-carrier-protein] S-malonyltransferase